VKAERLENRAIRIRLWLHRLGLPKEARPVAIFALAVVLLVDLALLGLDYWEHGLRGISGGYFLVDFWDVAKALGIGASLLVVAQRGKSKAITVLAVVFFLLAIEDLISLHGFVAYSLRALSGGLITRQIGELIAFCGFGLIVIVLVWGGAQPSNGQVQKARLTVTVLLIALFLFTAVVDFFAVRGTSVASIVEESGERLVLTLTTAYAAGLATIREW
jgi:hypothetical protein